MPDSRTPSQPSRPPSAPVPPSSGEAALLGEAANAEISRLDARSGSVLWGFMGDSAFAQVLIPLLRALKWRGDAFQLLEAFPHFSRIDSLSELLNVVANLRYESRSMPRRVKDVDARMLPCLFVSDEGDPYVLTRCSEGACYGFSGADAAYGVMPDQNQHGRAYFFMQQRDTKRATRAQQNWFTKLVQRFSKPLWHVLIITFFLNLLALATPFFIMLIYNQVLNFTEASTLLYVFSGIVIFIASGLALRLVRSAVMSYVGARVGNLVNNEVFKRLLFLPPQYTESASISAQLARIRDFETVREFISSNLFFALLDLPFILVLLGGMYLLSGSLVWIPVVAIVLFAIAAAVIQPFVSQAFGYAGGASSRKGELVMDILTKMRAIKYTGTAEMWLERYRQASAGAATSSFRASQLVSTINTISGTIITGAGAATLGVGVFMALDGTISMGAMIASLILVWRILAPVRSGFGIIIQLKKVLRSIHQVNNLMEIDLETSSASRQRHTRAFRGEVSFRHVSIRYSKTASPALLGVDFTIEPGQIVAVSGHDGAGKSTLLKLVMGMYQPQAGRVLVDQMNVRQYDTIALRRSIGYAPESPHFFYGTIAQNLLIAYPEASETELFEVCKRLNVMNEIARLPESFGTRIGDQKNANISRSLLTKLTLARALIKRSSIYLLDEVVDKLAPSDMDYLIEFLQEVKEDSTVIVVTNKPRLQSAADKVLLLEKGQMRKFGAPERVFARADAYEDDNQLRVTT